MRRDNKFSYQDIIVVNVDKTKPPNTEDTRRRPILLIALTALATLLLLAVGYAAGARAGLFPAHDVCCLGPLELDFDFDF